MIQDAWNTFPQQITQKINGLLDDAEPNQTKAFQLYKQCQSEDLWPGSFEMFSQHLIDFFKVVKSERNKSDFDRYLMRPMDFTSFENFHLTFRSAEIEPESVRDIASWAHHMLRLHFKNDLNVFSVEVLSQTIHDLTHPSFVEKDHDIEFEDFCISWQHSCHKLFGKQNEFIQLQVLSELRNLHQQQISKLQKRVISIQPTIYLTQTEIFWVESVEKAALLFEKPPRYPLSKGPEKNELIDLLKCTTLFEIAFGSDLPKLVAHREAIRETVLNRCRWLLENKRT